MDGVPCLTWVKVLSGEMVAMETLQEDKLQMFRKCLFTTCDTPARAALRLKGCGRVSARLGALVHVWAC